MWPVQYDEKQRHVWPNLVTVQCTIQWPSPGLHITKGGYQKSKNLIFEQFRCQTKVYVPIQPSKLHPLPFDQGVQIHPRLVYFLPHFWSPFLCCKGGQKTPNLDYLILYMDTPTKSYLVKFTSDYEILKRVYSKKLDKLSHSGTSRFSGKRQAAIAATCFGVLFK